MDILMFNLYTLQSGEAYGAFKKNFFNGFSDGSVCLYGKRTKPF